MRRVVAALLVGVIALVALPVRPATALAGHTYRKMTFPVVGASSYSDDWGDPRSGGRRHRGNDIFGVKRQALVAAVDGTVDFVQVDSGISGNLLTIEDAEGWEYWYIHVNNDTPGTDDGANPPEWRFGPGIEEGVKVQAGQLVAHLGDSGNAEGTAPHLHFELHRPDGSAVNPYHSLQLAQGREVDDRCGFESGASRHPSSASGAGYWSLSSDGGVFSFGAARFHGSMGGKPLNRPVMGLVATRTGGGYWELASDGGIFSFGDARFFGSTGGRTLNRPVVGMAATPSGAGYWLVASDGGIFSFGDAGFFGSTGGQVLNQPIVGMAPTRSGAGYWLVAADGGVFSFGDARFLGSTGGAPPGRVVGMTATPSGAGYWLLAASGVVVPFGDAASYGDPSTAGYCRSPGASRLVASRTGRGYWVQTADGETWAYGDAADHGSVHDSAIPSGPSVDLALAG